MMGIVYWLLGVDDPGAIAAAEGWSWHAAAPIGGVVLALVLIMAVAAASLNLLPGNVMRLPIRLSLTLIRLIGFAVLLVMLCQIELRVDVRRTIRPQVAV